MSVEYTFKRQEGLDLRLTGKVVAWVEDPEILLLQTEILLQILYLADDGTYVLVKVDVAQTEKIQCAFESYHPFRADNVIKNTTTLEPQEMFECKSKKDLREKLLELGGGNKLTAQAKELLDEAGIETFERID